LSLYQTCSILFWNRFFW